MIAMTGILEKPAGADAPLEIDLQNLPRARLEAMAAAGERILNCYGDLRGDGTSIVGEVLKGQGSFLEWDHYPAGDVYDLESHSQYYYHAHPPERRANLWGAEHGHFHTFLRPEGLPKSRGETSPPIHLMAISMDNHGRPIRLFATNRWVTGETWRPADDVIACLDRFAMSCVLPSRAVNVWITDMLRLFRPQVETLLHRRDAAIEAWRRDHPDINDPLEDRNLEVAAIADIAVDRQILAVDDALKAAG